MLFQYIIPVQPELILPDDGEFVSDLNPTFDQGANQAIERAAFFFADGLISDGSHHAIAVSFSEAVSIGNSGD
jgi:hypothetical protein